MSRLRATLLAAAMLAVLGSSACTQDVADDSQPAAGSTDDTAEQPDADSETDVEPADPPDPEDLENATRSASRFGFDLFHGLVGLDPEQNVITSPYSAAVLLTMLLNGADGETREAIGSVLHLDDPFDDTINHQQQTLAAYLTTADPDVELAIANSLWANEDTPFEDDYMSAMEDTFDARIEEADLTSQETADAIDEWVSEQTNERIDEIAEDLRLPNPNTILVLLNAVYFLGDWTGPFDPENTQDGIFTLSDGSKVEVPLMSRDGTFLHTQEDDFQVLRMPYGEEERFGMDVFLPGEDVELKEFRERLDPELWNESIANLNEQRVDVTLPSFELEYDTGDDMDDVLKDLGMGIAYGDADFSPMTSAGPWLNTVLQKTYIKVDEEGTEAAAVTGADLEVSEPPRFHADRPFMFSISDSETGTILFLGQVTDPSE